MATLTEIDTELAAMRAKYWDVDARLAYYALAALAERVLAEYPEATSIDAEWTDQEGTPSLIFIDINQGDDAIAGWDDEEGDGYLLCEGNRAHWEYFCTKVDNRGGQFTIDLLACRAEALRAARREEPYTV